ncbi:hypothetical protein [Propionibacterium acidifaciens]|uniref:hypothetical protein n=1 Tax=Propionibacterium acidifaciens TaxID=556499 RepID=UPI0028DC598A|nr:hypothetical protein [Propionibacterium acidifaciens]
MNTSEAAAILRLVAAATGQLVDQYAPDAWAVILDDVAPADAKLAVRAIARRPQPHDRRLAITPDLVLAEVRRIRARRIADAEHAFEPSPAARLDPAAYIAELRDHRARAAAGLYEQTAPAEELAARPAAALARRVGRSV